MIFLRNFIIIILLLILAAIAVVGVMIEWPTILNWTPDRINALGRSVLQVMRPDYLLFAMWASILLALLLVFFMTIARPRRRMKIEVQMGGGRVVIMDAAIKKYIRNALAELGEVTVKKIDLREHRNLVTTDITADVRTRENLPTLERRIISRVRTALAEDLGITNLGDVHVFIRNFEVTGRPIKPAPASADKSDTLKKRANDVAPEDEEAAPVRRTDKDDDNRFSGAAAAASTGGAALAGGHALADPVEPPGSTEPITISDTDAEDTSRSGTESGFSDITRAGVTESSDSEPVIIAEKAMPAQPDTTFGSDADTTTREDEDLDHPTPWSKPADDDRDEEDKGPLPL